MNAQEKVHRRTKGLVVGDIMFSLDGHNFYYESLSAIREEHPKIYNKTTVSSGQITEFIENNKKFKIELIGLNRLNVLERIVENECTRRAISKKYNQ